MNRRISGALFIVITTAMAAGRSAFWQTSFTGTGKPCPSARNTGFVCPARLWASLPGTRICLANSNSTNIRTAATAMRWRASLEPARLLAA